MRKRRGFALVVTVTLLALLVLLVVGLSALTRVETAVVRNETAADAARHQALAGLHVALGRLQTAAGPDRRVTATAAILAGSAAPSHPGNRRWTGVWDSAATAAAPVEWLVSGARPLDASRSPPAVGDADGDGVRLVGPGSVDGAVADGEVIVARERVSATEVPGATGPRTIGRFAYWIGDEGVKGNVSVVDRVGEIRIPAAPAVEDPVQSADERDRVRQLLAHRAGNDALNFAVTPWGFALGAEDDVASVDRWRDFGRALDDAQLRFQTFADATTASRYRAFLRRDFHALSVHSRGLLVNTAAGGLRQNWSDASVGPPEMSALERRRSLAGGRVEADGGFVPVGAPSVQVKPVVTELALDFVLFRDATADGAASGRLLAGVRLRIELWNPYPVALAHSPLGTTDYEFCVGGSRSAAPGDCGLPQLIVEAPRQPALVVGVLELSELLPPGRVIPIDCAGDLAAGATVVVETIVARDVATGLVVADASPLDASDDELALQVLPDPARTLGWEFRRARRVAGEQALTVATGFPSAGFRRTSVGGWSIPGNAPFVTEAPMRAFGLSYHARLNPARSRWADWIEPASAASPPPHDLFANALTFAGNDWTALAADPAENARSIAAQFASTDLFAGGRERCVLDLTQQRALSLGALHFVSHPGDSALLIGRPWGGARNEIFDAAFLLPLPRDWKLGDVLPNPRMQLLAPSDPWVASPPDPRGADAAWQIAVAGMFNVNATEPDAWVIALGRAVPQWRDRSGVVRRLENPFFACPQTAEFTTAANPGRRELSDTNVQKLAAELAERTARRGRPFGSLADWIASGICDEAIASAGLNSPGVGTTDLSRVPERMTAEWLTTATLLQTHAPFLAVRSDTFRVRVAGEAVNPTTGEVEARAYLEAIVQRFPELVDRSGAIDSDATGYGRRFEVVAFRWMSAEEL